MFSSCCDVQRKNIGNPLWAEGVNVIYILRAQRAYCREIHTLPSTLLGCDVVDTFSTASSQAPDILIWGRPISRANTVKVEKVYFLFLLQRNGGIKLCFVRNFSASPQ